jgi:hypothetical protein
MRILSNTSFAFSTHPLYWALILCSPAFIFVYPAYSAEGIAVTYLAYLALVLALLSNLYPAKGNLLLIFSMVFYAISVKINPYLFFALPFFCFLPQRGIELGSVQSKFYRLAPFFFTGVAVLGLILGTELPAYNLGFFSRSLHFYAGFLILLLLALAPLFFIRIRLQQWFLFGACFLSIFSLVGFGLDWGYCLHLFSCLFFITLVGRRQSIAFKPNVSRISLLVVLLYALLWNIPSPFVGMPGFGVYGALHHAYPRLEMQDPLRHPFWREAAERYENVKVGVYRNGIPPDTPKLEFLLKRTGVKNIQLLTAPNAGVVSQPPNSQTYYVLDDWGFSPSLRLSPDVTVDLLARIDGYLVYAPGWKVCKTCREIAKDLQIASIPPNVNLNKAIFFNKGGQGVELLGGGWSQPEIWGVWSDGGLATIFVPKPKKVPKKILIDLRVFVSPANPIQDISISVNDQFLREYTFDKAEGNLLALELPSSNDDFYKITFQLKTPARPFDLGIYKDKRLLGIGLISAKFE